MMCDVFTIHTLYYSRCVRVYVRVWCMYPSGRISERKFGTYGLWSPLVCARVRVSTNLPAGSAPGLLKLSKDFIAPKENNIGGTTRFTIFICNVCSRRREYKSTQTLFLSPAIIIYLVRTRTYIIRYFTIGSISEKIVFFFFKYRYLYNTRQ